jgi:hypothetical protein
MQLPFRFGIELNCVPFMRDLISGSCINIRPVETTATLSETPLGKNDRLRHLKFA